MRKLKIAFACDHAGFELKEELINYCNLVNYTIKDFGSFSNESVDYPSFAHPLARAIETGEFDFGVSICGSGNGVNMVVNKYKKIRSALCWRVEIARLAREHNDANICAIPSRFVSYDEALSIIITFFSSKFQKGRHMRRIKKIPIH